MIPLLRKEPQNLLEARWPNTGVEDTEFTETAARIIEDVRARGDLAIVKYTQKFDGVTVDPKQLVVGEEEVEAAYLKVTASQVESLEKAKARLEVVESRRIKGLSFDHEIEGVRIYSRVRPLRRVGCYVPGGKAAYPSTVIMNVTPAKVAGVGEVVVATPPGPEGSIPPLTLVAADICGVDRIYRIGGIQAIAALAFGTETVGRVDKIVGPGNKYVTAAKSQVSHWVAIDKPAGPTEILVIADEFADPRIIAMDLISQAEHGYGGISGLITTSEALAKEVQNELSEMVPKIPRSKYVREVLESGGFIYLTKSLDDAADFADRFGPEHLEIQTREPRELAEKVGGAGLILLGEYTPVSATDYCMGVNHVLPTNGYGRISSGLTVIDFLKLVDVVESSREGLQSVRDNVRTLSDAEGLPNHGLAVEGRFKA
jgi:histidinol dehydrogenase